MKNKLSSGFWQEKSPMEIARSHPAVATYKGKLYVFGGGGPNFASLNSVVAFDPSTNTWAPCSDMPTRRSGTIAAVVGNRIYIIGGGFKHSDGNFRFLNKVEIYDPETDQWDTGPDMLMPHDYPAGALLGNYIYILGGHHPDSTTSGPKTDPGFDFCERLDLKQGVWEQIAALPTPRFALSAITMNNKVLAMGGVAFTPEGFSNFTVAEAYDPATDTWTELPEIALPWPAAGHGTCLLVDTPYVFGGYSGEGIHNRAARYNLKTKTWHTIAPMPNRRAAMGVGVVGNSAYLFGGWADDGRTPMKEVYEYQSAG